jgi:uncharacterized repeat protein (TIGR02543 family)
MRKSLRISLALAASSVLVATVGLASAQASPTAIPLSNGSTFSTYDCGGSGLSNVNLSTLAVTPASAAHTCYAAPNSVAYNPVDAHIYGLAINGATATLIANDVQGRELSTFAGNSNHKVVTGTTANAVSFAINPLDGTAYLNDADGKFYTLNLTTGVASSPIQSSPNVGGLYGLAFSPSGTLYGYANSVGADLVSINPATGASAVVKANFKSGIEDVAGNDTIFGMTFDANGNVYFVANSYHAGDGDGGSSVYSSTMDDFSANSAMFKTTLGGTHTWVGNASSWSSIGAPIITYGNLAVSFNSEGGSTSKASRFYSSTVLNSVTPVMTNSAITLPSTTRRNYTLLGWFDAASGGNKIGDAGDTYTPDSTESITLYAQWESSTSLASTGSNLDEIVGTGLAGGTLVLAGLGFVLYRRRQTSK